MQSAERTLWMLTARRRVVQLLWAFAVCLVCPPAFAVAPMCDPSGASMPAPTPAPPSSTGDLAAPKGCPDPGKAGSVDASRSHDRVPVAERAVDPPDRVLPSVVRFPQPAASRCERPEQVRMPVRPGFSEPVYRPPREG